MRFKRILCLADTAGSALTAMREAALAAEKENAALQFLYVVPRPDPVSVLFPHLHERRIQDIPPRIGSSARLVEHAALATGLAEGRFGVIVETGSVDAAIAAAASGFHCDLLVLPGVGASARVIRSLHCAVLIARENEGAGVLAATDLTDSSIHALRTGKVAAGWSGQDLTGFFSLNLPAIAPMGPGAELGAYVLSTREIDEVNRHFRVRLHEAMSTVDPKGKEILEHGPAADAILRTAARLKSALIVVGSRDKGLLPRLLEGSVSEFVAQHAPCSVLVVKLGRNSDQEAA